MEENKYSIWIKIGIILVFACVNTVVMSKYMSLANKLDMTRMELTTVMGERDNALARSEQWERQYQDALFEIAELKEKLDSAEAENNELTHWNEEVSAAMDDMLENGWTDLGTFKITYYCHCAKCNGKYAYSNTASGAYPKSGKTVAVDKSVIPLGSKVCIDGHVYIAEDTGVKGNTIDIFVDSHEEARNLGVKYREVKVMGVETA